MLWRPPRRSWCMHRILCTACNRNSTRSFERGHDGNILEEAYRGRYARQRLLNFWPESSCGYHAIKRFVCIIQVLVLVVGLVLYTASARDPQARPDFFDGLQLLLVVSALVVDALALVAIGARISGFGFTPNRVAALGENLILLVNLTWSAWLYARFLRD